MLSLRNINPMVRAVGTMGAVAALVGGITFALGSSNTVALTPNNITTGTASIQISSLANIGAACGTFGGSTTGIQDPALAPGSSGSVNFCLNNNGSMPLTLTASIPQVPIGGTAASDTTLTVACISEGSLSSTLTNWGPGTFGSSLAKGAIDQCTATAALSASYTGSGGETIPGFSIDFIGNQ